MTVKGRLKKLEERASPKPGVAFWIYYAANEKGYSADLDGPYYPTFAALATAQGWEVGEKDVLVEVRRASEAVAESDLS